MIRYSLVLVLCWLNLSWACAQEPWAVMSGKSIVEVRSGLRHMYQRLGRKDLVAALDSAAVTNLVSGNLKGLELTKPLGAIVVPNKDGQAVLLTFVPATDPEKFRGFLARHAMPVQPLAAGIEQVTMPLLGKVVLRFEQDYAWFAMQQEDLQLPLPNVKTLLPKSHQETLLGATLYLERMPANQRQLWQARLQQGMQTLLASGGAQKGDLVESVGLSVSSLLLHRLSEDAREFSLLAHADTRRDDLWAKMIIVPSDRARWQKPLQLMGAQRLEFPASAWARLRGKTNEAAEQAAVTAFKNGNEDKLVLTMTGGDSMELKAEMKGTLLAYHAALNNGAASAEKSKPNRRERPRRPRK